MKSFSFFLRLITASRQKAVRKNRPFEHQYHSIGSWMNPAEYNINLTFVGTRFLTEKNSVNIIPSDIVKIYS